MKHINFYAFFPGLQMFIGLLFLSGCLFHHHDHSSHDHGETTHTGSGTQVFSENGSYSVTVTYDKAPVLASDNMIHLLLKNNKADLVDNADISAATWMPMHNHGSSPDPQVDNMGEGIYMVKNINFNMDGQWQLKLDITVSDEKDQIIIPFSVDP